MFDLSESQAWADAFGLADDPMFATRGRGDQSHRVLLDGGFGTFALSVEREAEGIRETRASWIWSSDIPHHVLVTPDQIFVVRWDDLTSERHFTRASVEQRVEDFYRFLVLDRVTEGRRVIEHAIELFRRIRALIGDADAEGESIEAFLLLLAAMIEDTPFQAYELANLANRYSLSDRASPALLSAPSNALEALIEEYSAIQIESAQLRLHPDLAVRHAGGVIFQEAHFEIIRSAPPDLFGYIPQPAIKPRSRGGVHFTPPALARSIVEQTLAALGDVGARSSIILTDPACGSGAFLIEAIRALHRLGFRGSLKVCGRDTSKHAIAMARFAVMRTLGDWQLSESAIVDLQVRDALAGC